MARYPLAEMKLLPESATQSGIRPAQVILHSAVDAPGPTSLFPYFDRVDVVLESHFFVRLDGTVEQYMDTEVRADANYHANKRVDGTGAISIETEDEGRPEALRWTGNQLAAIRQLLTWIWRTHPAVARRVCRDHADPGIGYHSMWGAPSEWTPVPGKTCPGGIRIKQFEEDLTPWINDVKPVTAEQEETDMFTFSFAGKATFFVSGGVKNGMHNQKELAAVQTAYKAEHGRDLMNVSCASLAQWTNFSKNYPGD